MCSWSSEKILGNDHSYYKGEGDQRVASVLAKWLYQLSRLAGCVNKEFFFKFTYNKNKNKALSLNIDANSFSEILLSCKNLVFCITHLILRFNSLWLNAINTANYFLHGKVKFTIMIKNKNQPNKQNPKNIFQLVQQIMAFRVACLLIPVNFSETDCHSHREIHCYRLSAMVCSKNGELFFLPPSDLCLSFLRLYTAFLQK